MLDDMSTEGRRARDEVVLQPQHLQAHIGVASL